MKWLTDRKRQKTRTAAEKRAAGLEQRAAMLEQQVEQLEAEVVALLRINEHITNAANNLGALHNLQHAASAVEMQALRQSTYATVDEEPQPANTRVRERLDRMRQQRAALNGEG